MRCVDCMINSNSGSVMYPFPSISMRLKENAYSSLNRI